MEILYLYIAENELLPHADLNFGGSHLFAYNQEKKKLDVRVNPFYIKDFFDHETSDGVARANMVNITGIVGENGAGKSSLLNYLLEILPRGALWHQKANRPRPSNQWTACRLLFRRTFRTRPR